MGVVRVLMVVTTVLVTLFAVYIHRTVPDTLAEPWKYRLVRAQFDYPVDLGVVLEFLGITDQITWQREFTDSATLSAPDPDPNTIKVSNDVVDGVKVRMYEPLTAVKNRPGLVYAHSGGFRILMPKAYDVPVTEYAIQTNAVIMSIDYRMAPSHPAPTPWQDCEKAARYFFKNADRWGVDPTRIGIAGDSAGGNLAAALPIRFRDTGGSPQFLFHVPISPWLQGVDHNLPSYQQNDAHNYRYMTQDGMIKFLLPYVNQTWDHVTTVRENRHVRPEVRESCRKFVHWELLPKELIFNDFRPVLSQDVDEDLADAIVDDLLDPLNFPLMADNLENLPPALVVVHEHDVLRDEGLMYARRMKEAGVDVTLFHEKRCFHGCTLFAKGMLAMDAARVTVQTIIDYMNEQFERNV